LKTKGFFAPPIYAIKPGLFEYPKSVAGRFHEN